MSNPHDKNSASWLAHEENLARAGVSTYTQANALERERIAAENRAKEQALEAQRNSAQQMADLERQRTEERTRQKEEDDRKLRERAAKEKKYAAAQETTQVATPAEPPVPESQHKRLADRKAFVLVAIAVGALLHFVQGAEPIIAVLGSLVAGAFAYRFWRPALILAAVGSIGYLALKDDMVKKSGVGNVIQERVVGSTVPTATQTSRVEKIAGFAIPDGGWLRIVKGGERLLVADQRSNERFDWHGLWRRFKFSHEAYCDAFSVKELSVKEGIEVLSAKVANLCWTDVSRDSATWGAVNSRGELVIVDPRDWSVIKTVPLENARIGSVSTRNGHAFVIMKHELTIQKVSLDTGKILLEYRAINLIGGDPNTEQPRQFSNVNILEGEKIVGVTETVGPLGASAHYEIIFDAISGKMLDVARHDFSASLRDEGFRFLKLGLGTSWTRDKARSKDGTYEYLLSNKVGVLVRSSTDDVIWRHELAEDPTSVTFSDDNRFLVWSDYGKGFGVIDTRTGQVIARRDHSKMWFLAFSPDGSEMYTCCREEAKTFGTTRHFERWTLK